VVSNCRGLGRHNGGASRPGKQLLENRNINEPDCFKEKRKNKHIEVRKG
jgi:hypothetical protein